MRKVDPNKVCVTLNTKAVKGIIDAFLPEKLLKYLKNYKLEIKEGENTCAVTRYIIANIEINIRIKEFYFSKKVKILKGTYEVEGGKFFSDMAKMLMDVSDKKSPHVKLSDNEFEVLFDNTSFDQIANYLNVKNLDLEEGHIRENVSFGL